MPEPLLVDLRPGRGLIRPGRIAFFFGKHFWQFVTPHGVKITWWVIKYPLIKKNAATTITQQCPNSAHKPKVTYTWVFLIFEKFAHGKTHTPPQQIMQTATQVYLNDTLWARHREIIY